MPTAIIETTIGGIGDNRVTLENSQFARLMDVGSDWTKIRVAIRRTMSDTGDNLTSTPRFYFGLMSNPVEEMTNGPLGNNTSHFVGIRWDDSFVTRSISPANGPYYACSSVQLSSVNSGVITNGNSTVNETISANNVESTGRATIAVIEIERTASSGSWNFNIVANDSIAAAHMTRSDLIFCLELSDIADVETFLDTKGTYINFVRTLTVDEDSNGPLNSICIAWDRSDPRVEISDVGYSIIEE